ncbi:hypothetical protein B566_EDAN012281 [Ephemera danica]|nr:hypothetical protein B566_EDAN012281 [Ephemera danica]
MDLISKADISKMENMFAKKDWTPAEILELINLYRESPELWDKDRPVITKYRKEQLLGNIALAFNADIPSVARKLHHLRTQFNEESRKVERTRSLKPEERYVPRWMYFSELSFLSSRRKDIINMENKAKQQQPSTHEVDTVTPQFKFEQSFVEEDSFGFSNCSENNKADSLMPYGIHQEDEDIDTSPKQQQHHHSPQQCLTPVPQSSGNKRSTPHSGDDDEYDVFAAFVSSEIRGLRHESNRKKLKCSIMRAVLKAIEDEDTAIQNLGVRTGF